MDGSIVDQYLRASVTCGFESISTAEVTTRIRFCSASLGVLGKTADARVQDAIAHGIKTVRTAAKAAGVLSTVPTIARKYLDLGALFVAVRIDTTLLVRAARDLRALFKDVAGFPQS